MNGIEAEENKRLREREREREGKRERQRKRETEKKAPIGAFPLSRSIEDDSDGKKRGEEERVDGRGDK